MASVAWLNRRNQKSSAVSAIRPTTRLPESGRQSRKRAGFAGHGQLPGRCAGQFTNNSQRMQDRSGRTGFISVFGAGGVVRVEGRLCRSRRSG